MFHMLSNFVICVLPYKKKASQRGQIGKLKQKAKKMLRCCCKLIQFHATRKLESILFLLVIDTKKKV